MGKDRGGERRESGGAGKITGGYGSGVIHIFVRVPESGTVKTRLIPLLGASGAARLAAAMAGDAVELVRESRLPFRVVLSGPIDHPWVRTLDCEVEAQAEGDLGARLAHALRDGGVAIGSDAPTLPVNLLLEAHASTADVVLAPAFDGGFTLVGTQEPEDLFDLVPWSAPDTFARQHRRALDLGRSVRVLPFWYDVDDAESLRFLGNHLSTLPERVAARTRGFLAGWRERSA